MQYIDDHSGFIYVATVNYPIPQPQIDWVDQVIILESWLESCVGPRLERWAYHHTETQMPWQACIAFRAESDLTLFLLRWAN